MKKQPLLFFLLACTFFSFAMHRRKVYAEEETFTKQYHRCWQRCKHAITCPCASICASAIKGVYAGNLSLLIPHLPHNTNNEEGATLFNTMLRGGNTSHYCDILELLMKRGFNPTRSYGDFGPAISSIVGLQSIALFKIAAQIPFENEVECKEIFNKLYGHIDVRPEEGRTFYYKALIALAEKNPHTAARIVSYRMKRRRRILTYRATVDSILPVDYTPQRIPGGRHSVPQAWGR
jgi:hypothetical protein